MLALARPASAGRRGLGSGLSLPPSAAARLPARVPLAQLLSEAMQPRTGARNTASLLLRRARGREDRVSSADEGGRTALAAAAAQRAAEQALLEEAAIRAAARVIREAEDAGEQRLHAHRRPRPMTAGPGAWRAGGSGASGRVGPAVVDREHPAQGLRAQIEEAQSLALARFPAGAWPLPGAAGQGGGALCPTAAFATYDESVFPPASALHPPLRPTPPSRPAAAAAVAAAAGDQRAHGRRRRLLHTVSFGDSWPEGFAQSADALEGVGGEAGGLRANSLESAYMQVRRARLRRWICFCPDSSINLTNASLPCLRSPPPQSLRKAALE